MSAESGDVANAGVVGDETSQGLLHRRLDGLGARNRSGPGEEVVFDLDKSLGHRHQHIRKPVMDISVTSDVGQPSGVGGSYNRAEATAELGGNRRDRLGDDQAALLDGDKLRPQQLGEIAGQRLGHSFLGGTDQPQQLGHGSGADGGHPKPADIGRVDSKPGFPRGAGELDRDSRPDLCRSPDRSARGQCGVRIRRTRFALGRYGRHM